MKLPLFAKNKNGKWEVFPFHLLEEFRGKPALVFYPGIIDWEKSAALTKFMDKFDPPIHPKLAHPHFNIYPLKVETT
jgi:hypothetical protein